MIHASYAYPSHLPIVVELALLTLTLLLAGAGRRWASAVKRLVGRVARPWRWLLGLALLAVVLQAGQSSVLGPPVPHVTDEDAYLLAADTFAAGRLTNPPHPCWRHLGNHVLQQPTRSSKYPPAQGLWLALGQRLAGDPAISLWWGSGLLVFAVGWMLWPWVGPRWALLGAVVVLLRLAVGSYWNQSFWGGTVAAVAGALVFGALRRFADRPSARMLATMAAGVVILACSRPFEGMLVTLPVAAAVAWQLARHGRRIGGRRTLGLVVPGLVVLLVGTGFAMLHNLRVTGDPWWLPHRAWGAGYHAPPELIFVPWDGRIHEIQGGPDLVPFSRATMALAGSDPDARWRPGWLGQALRQAPERAMRGLYFFLGLAWLVPLVFWSGSIARDPWLRLALVAVALVLVGHGLTWAWFPHYDAPIVGPLFVVAVAAQKRLWAWRWRARPIGPVAVVAALVAHGATYLVQLPAHRPDPDDASRLRGAVERSVAARPGRHLVVVSGDSDWVANRASIERARVVWARDLGPDGDRALAACFPGRTPWQLDLRLGARGTPEAIRMPAERRSAWAQADKAI